MVSTVPPRTRRTSMPGPFPTAPWVPSAAHLATSQRQEGRCPYRRVHRDRHPPCLGLNGGPAFQHNEAFSFQVATDDQAETDRLWNAIVGVGDGACGWCKDRWGLSWQIIPRPLTAGMADPDPAVGRRVFEAMMKMRKIDVAAIEAARRA